MSDYAYTYDLRQDEDGFNGLTETQQELGRAVNERAREGEDGGDRYLILKRISERGRLVAAEDVAVLAELWGGPGAGEEFLR